MLYTMVQELSSNVKELASRDRRDTGRGRGDIECWNCGAYGHPKFRCPNPKQGDGEMYRRNKRYRENDDDRDDRRNRRGRDEDKPVLNLGIHPGRLKAGRDDRRGRDNRRDDGFERDKDGVICNLSL